MPIYLAKVETKTAPGLAKVIKRIRELSPALTEDRSLTLEIESLAAMLSADDFAFVRSVA